MISSAGLLDFFILEAGDYVERLDGLLASAGAGGPEADAFARHARALRGSATMAKLGGMAELAGGVERVGRGLREGTIAWSPALAAAVIAAIDDLKLLVRAVRTWGTAEDRRVHARVTELASFTGGLRTPAVVPAIGASGADWLATEAAEIAAAIEAASPGAGGAAATAPLADLLRRVRAMRGVAAVKDHPALASVLDGIERAARPLEVGRGVGSREAAAVMRAGVDALRRIALALAAAHALDAGTPELERFAQAADALAAATAGSDRVLPIDALYYDDDGPHVVSRAPAPPTTPAVRFRLEVVSQAEHLRALVGEGRAARTAGDRDRIGRALAASLGALRDLADGFGQRRVSDFVAASGDGVARLDALALGALDEVAALLANPATSDDELALRVVSLARGRGVDTAIGAAMSDVADREPAGVTTTEPRLSDALGALAVPPETLPSIEEFTYAETGESAHADVGADEPVDAARAASDAPALPTRRPPTPTGRALHAMLEDSIAGITRLEQSPLSEPVPVVDDSLVDVDSLLYGGPSALQRARELVHALRAAEAPPTDETVDELLDLLELAAAR